MFTVELPTSSASPDPMQETAEGIPAIKSSPRGTVLLIEDNELACRSTARVLRSCGYTVTTAGGGLEGLEKYRAQVPAFQAVVLDWTMPQMTGADTAAALYAIDPNVRILAISGYQSAVEVTASAHAGVRHFLGKPFTQESIDISLQLIL